jgi:hypothetical protein
MRARRGRRRLRATDDHQELIRPYERDRRPRGHNGADDVVAQPVGDIRGERRNNAQAEQPSRARACGHLAAPGPRITIALA